MYSSYLNNLSNGGSYSYGQSFPKQNFSSYGNHYYTSKIYDDHGFERRKLQRPGFLIKQQKIYPQSSSYSIDSVLNYADNLVKPSNNRFYCEAAEEERVRVQGKNPFLSDDRYFSDLSQMSYLKKSSRSRLDTNPNLGVTSYQVLEQSQHSERYRKKPVQAKQNSSRFQKQNMQDYISESLFENFGKKTQPGIAKNNNIIREEEEDSGEAMFYDIQKRQTFNPVDNVSKKYTSTIVKPKDNPQLLVYKGKKYMKLIM